MHRVFSACNLRSFSRLSRGESTVLVPCPAGRANESTDCVLDRSVNASHFDTGSVAQKSHQPNRLLRHVRYVGTRVINVGLSVVW